MKKIAFLLFMVFAAVQLTPSVMAVFSDNYSVFIVDEEKNEDKGNNTDTKVKKDYAVFSSPSAQINRPLISFSPVAEKIYSSPCLEKLAPPPNFC